MNQTIIDTIAPRLTELVIKKIETLTGDWQKPWIADMTHGLPRNLRGTPYRAGNVLILLFLSEIMGYRTPVFMTFRPVSYTHLDVYKRQPYNCPHTTFRAILPRLSSST